MRIEWQWPAAVVFAVVFVSLSALVYTGKMQPEALLALLAWLIPSPAHRQVKP